MKLKEVFDQLSIGEFSQISIGGQNAGVIDETNYDKLIGHVNLGLTNLFKRFYLKEGTLKVLLQLDQVKYSLTSPYAVNSRRSREPVRYIIDSEIYPFADDIQKIERIITDSGVELMLNDKNDPWSISTPSVKEIHVPKAYTINGLGLPELLRTTYLTIMYRANHPTILIPVGFFDPARVEIELPSTHLEALLYFVASRVHAPIGMANEFNASNIFYAKYEQACKDLENQGLQTDQGSSRTRFERNGWC